MSCPSWPRTGSSRPKTGNWNCCQLLAEWHKVGAVIEDDSVGETVTACLGQDSQPCEITGHHGCGGLDFDPRDRAVVAFKNDVNLVHLLVTEMVGRQLHVRCRHQFEDLREHIAFEKGADFLRSALILENVNPFAAASRPQSRKCSLGVFTIRFNSFVYQGCNVETRKTCSSNLT